MLAALGRKRCKRNAILSIIAAVIHKYHCHYYYAQYNPVHPNPNISKRPRRLHVNESGRTTDRENLTDKGFDRNR